VANGTLDKPENAEEMIRSEADIVALGKGALANMDWPNRVREDRSLEGFDPAVLESLRRL
jgi:2,4-dienoyl-CoA reductase-like NADH-dependent reductase (Old Yellow Enzyme family)